MPGGVADGVTAQTQLRRIPVHILHHPATYRQRICPNADAVPVHIRSLHCVREQVALETAGRAVTGYPRIIADGECQPQPRVIVGVIDILVKDHHRLDPFTGNIHAAPGRRADDRHLPNPRLTQIAPVHLVEALRTGEAAQRQIGAVAVAVRRRSPGYGQRIGGNADPVRIAVPRLHRVAQGKNPSAYPGRSPRLPRILPDIQRQRQPGAGTAQNHQFVKLDDNRDDLAPVVGIVACRPRTDAHAGHLRPRRRRRGRRIIIHHRHRHAARYRPVPAPAGRMA